MRIPIVCVDERLRQYIQTFADCFSRPQFKHFVIVLMGLLLCQGKRTLTGLLRSVAVKASLASLSRFLSGSARVASEQVGFDGLKQGIVVKQMVKLGQHRIGL
jgi:hypothetical protein